MASLTRDLPNSSATEMYKITIYYIASNAQDKMECPDWLFAGTYFTVRKYLGNGLLRFFSRGPVNSRSTYVNYSKTSFEKNCFSAWASTLNMGLINKVNMVCLSPVGYGV